VPVFIRWSAPVWHDLNAAMDGFENDQERIQTKSAEGTTIFPKGSGGNYATLANVRSESARVLACDNLVL
jgi:hypothetical protein